MVLLREEMGDEAAGVGGDLAAILAVFLGHNTYFPPCKGARLASDGELIRISYRSQLSIPHDFGGTSILSP